MKSQEYRGSLYAIASGFLYGFIGYFGISALDEHLSVSTMLFWRFFISSIIILVIVLPQLRKINNSAAEMFRAFGIGAFYYGCSTLLYFFASQYLGTGLAMVIFFTYPVMIMLLNYFLYGQFIPKLYYLAISIILVGMLFLINFDQMTFDLSGIFLALASAFFYAGYILFSKRNPLPPNLATLMVSLGCMSTSLLVSFLSNTFAVPATLNLWLNLLGIGVVATVIPVLLMLYSLKYLSSEKASLLSVLEPVFVVILGVLLLGEELQSWHVLGIIFILIGALLTLFSSTISVQEKLLSKEFAS